jgi:phospholipase C
MRYHADLQRVMMTFRIFSRTVVLSFIEPRYSNNVADFPYPPNSNHPGSSACAGFPKAPSLPAYTDVADGEAFLVQLYDLIQGSSIWNSCLLIITYDEHGGMYDHVPPLAATPPGTAYPNINIPVGNNDDDPAVDGFAFNYFGVRVPAIVVSPLIPPGTTVAPQGAVPFDHTSIIKTVWDCFGLSSVAPSLTSRDAAAPSLLPSLTASTPNNPGVYSGPPLSSPVIEASRVAMIKTPAEAAALFKGRVLQSARGTNPET